MYSIFIEQRMMKCKPLDDVLKSHHWVANPCG